MNDRERREKGEGHRKVERRRGREEKEKEEEEIRRGKIELDRKNREGKQTDNAKKKQREK